MNSLEFCNAVVQVAHDLIKTQLLDFMYAGFIVPVLGPAILQVFALMVFVRLKVCGGGLYEKFVLCQCLQVVVHILYVYINAPNKIKFSPTKN